MVSSRNEAEEEISGLVRTMDLDDLEADELGALAGDTGDSNAGVRFASQPEVLNAGASAQESPQVRRARALLAARTRGKKDSSEPEKTWFGLTMAEDERFITPNLDTLEHYCDKGCKLRKVFPQ
jgi:hypothetical protein